MLSGSLWSGKGTFMTLIPKGSRQPGNRSGGVEDLKRTFQNLQIGFCRKDAGVLSSRISTYFR